MDMLNGKVSLWFLAVVLLLILGAAYLTGGVGFKASVGGGI